MDTHMTLEAVTRQSDAQGGFCEDCGATFNITTCPYWHWSKSVAMHRDGTGHTVTLYRIVSRALSPMARRVSANKAAQLRTGGERPMGSDESR